MAYRSDCSFIPEERGHSGHPGMLPLAEVTHVLPHSLDLGLPGRAVHEQVVTSLPHVLTAPPALIGRQLVDFIAQVIASRCMP